MIVKKCDSDPVIKEKLDRFRELVKQKTCKMWEHPSDLGSKVSRSLIKLMRSQPAIGWVRADKVLMENSASEILRLKNKIEELNLVIAEYKSSSVIQGQELSQGDDIFELSYTAYVVSTSHDKVILKPHISDTIELTWNTLFFIIGPLLIAEIAEYRLNDAINHYITNLLSSQLKHKEMACRELAISYNDFNQIIIQFRALGLMTKGIIPRDEFDQQTYWVITPYGDKMMLKNLALKK